MTLRAFGCAALLALSGCADTPNNPARALFRSGDDARTYNPMTGRYEWPDESTTPRTRISSGTRPAQGEASPPDQRGEDARTYNPQSGRFEGSR